MLQTFNQLQKHTRRVLITKRTLPVFAFLLVALMIAWPAFQKQKESFAVSISSSRNGTKVDMENVRFFGLNDKKLPLTLSTPSGKEIDTGRHTIRIEKPTADYQMNTKEILTGKTAYALVHQDTQEIFFEDTLNIITSSGYVANTGKILCDYNQGTCDTNSPISIKGPVGKIDATGIWMADKGNLILFKKKVQATIHQKKEQIKLSSPDGAQIDQNQKTLTTLGKTTLLHQENTLVADKMVVYYTDDKNSKIEKIIASGNVSVQNNHQKMVGNTGIYDPIAKIITMEGNVILSQGNNNVKSDKATLNLITGKSDLKARGRIKGQLIPNQLERVKDDTK